MSVKLQTERHFEFLSFKGGCTGSSESTLVKMPHCWKSHATAHILPDYYHCHSQLKPSALFFSCTLDAIVAKSVCGHRH